MYKILIVGCGMMSDAWLKNILSREDCEIVGLVDININAANRKKENFKLTNVNTYSNIESALDKENANLVIDVTVPESHFETVTTALKAGCNVFGEKPMSDSLENAEKMVKCAEEANREYFVMQNRRYLPRLYALRNFLNSNQLGNIGQISANFQLDPHFGGFREEMDSPLIADMAIHTFDACRFLSGQNAVSVYCQEFNPLWSWYKGNANAVCIFEMEDGTIFDYRGSWCANGLNTSWESEWRIACENGAAFWDGSDKLFYDLTATSTSKTGISGDDEITSSMKELTPFVMKHTGHDACINEMFDALKSGIRPQTDCRDNINSIKMVYKAIESARTNMKVLI